MTTAANFPNISPVGIEIELVENTIIQTSLSGRETRQQIGRPFWRFVAQFANLTDAQRRQIAGHIANAKGPLLQFSFALPTNINSNLNTESYVTLANLAAGATSFQVNAANYPDSEFQSGDYFTIASDPGLYQVTADVDASSMFDTPTVNFYPPLNVASTTGDTINHTNISINVRYESDFSYLVRNDLYSSFELIFVEVLN